MSKRFVLVIIVALIALSGFVGIFLWRCSGGWCLVFHWQKVRAVENFEQCAQLGFPIMESYPRQCTVDGKTYRENVPPIVPPSLTIPHIIAPAPYETLTSPFVVYGEAPGTWYFEASFPLQLLDGNGKVIVATHVQAKSDWMVTGLVPFETALVFDTPTTATGTLVIQKDNPSGLPQNAGSFSIPVRFEKPAVLQGEGTLDGTMSIGPICPVERIDHPCLPTPEMYAAHPVFVYAPDRTTILATLTPDAEGKFHATLPAGTYYIDTGHQSFGRISGVPVTVSITAGKSVAITITIDTGIR